MSKEWAARVTPIEAHSLVKLLNCAKNRTPSHVLSNNGLCLCTAAQYMLFSTLDSTPASPNRQFSRGIASLLEGKSRGLCQCSCVQNASTTFEPLLKDKKLLLSR